MNKSKLFTYLQTEAAEYAIPPLLDVVTERVHDHRMTREPREFHHSETRYHCPPNEGFGHYDSSWVEHSLRNCSTQAVRIARHRSSSPPTAAASCGLRM